MGRIKSLYEHYQDRAFSDYEFNEYMKNKEITEAQRRRELNNAKHMAQPIWHEDMPDLQDEALAQAEQEFVDTLNIKHGSR